MNRTVVVYSEKNDPVVLALNQAPGIALIHVDDLTRSLKRAPWPRLIEINYDDETVAQYTGARLINRVFSLAGTTLHERLESWGLRDQWGYIAIQPLFAKASKVFHDTGVRGVSRSMLPLNTQWFHLEGKVAGVSMPKFVYEFGGEMPDLSHMLDPMQKSVWSFFDWKEEHRLAPKDSKWHRFFVERPRGTPVVASFVEDSVEFVFPRGQGAEFDHGVFGQLVTTVRQVFKSEIGEVLAFVDGNSDIKFHAFAPQAITTGKTTTFREAVMQTATA